MNIDKDFDFISFIQEVLLKESPLKLNKCQIQLLEKLNNSKFKIMPTIRCRGINHESYTDYLDELENKMGKLPECMIIAIDK